MQGKVWGKTECIFKNDVVEVHRIEANKGGFSSEHRHRFKWNKFYMESGEIQVLERRSSVHRGSRRRTVPRRCRGPALSPDRSATRNGRIMH